MARNPNSATLPGFAGVSYRCLAILDDLADGLSMAQSAKRNGWPTTSVVQSVIRMKARIGVRSEERAPDDETPIICLLKKDGIGCTWHSIVQGRFINRFGEPEKNTFFWRPLDLPEENNA